MLTKFPARNRALFLLPLLLLACLATSAFAKDQEKDKEKPAKAGYLGVMLQDVNGSLAKALQLGDDEAVMVTDVVDGGPAEAAGLEDGDVIFSFNGEKVGDTSELTRAVRRATPGDKAKLEIQHNGKRQTIEVEVGAAKQRSFSFRTGTGRAPQGIFEGDDGDVQVFVMPDGDDDTAEFLVRRSLGGDRGFMGVELGQLNEQLGDYFGVKDGEGALINSVNEEGPAADAGLKAGDVIVAIDGEDIESSGDVHRALADTEPGQELKLTIVRKGSRSEKTIKLGEMPEGNSVGALRWLSAPDAPHFEHEFSFPEGLDRDIRVVAPVHGLRKMHERKLTEEDAKELKEMRDELDTMRKELKELQKELKK